MSEETSIDSQVVTTDKEKDLKPWGMELKQFVNFMHLSQLAGFLVPFGGLILPIVMWSSFKDESPTVNEHGKDIINWIISSVIYIAISIVLCVIIIGIPLLIILGLCSLIFPIIGFSKASSGQRYKYPMSIRFIK